MRVLRRYGWLGFLLIAACFFAAQALVPRDWEIPAKDHASDRWIESIVVLNGWLYLALLGTCFVFAVLLLVMIIRCAGGKESRAKRGLFLVGVIAYAFSFLPLLMNNLAPWTYHGSVTTADGSTFLFLDSSFLQGQTMALGKLVERSPFLDRFQVLVTNNGDSPRSYARIVRPQGADDTYGQIYLTPSDLLVGVRRDNLCHLAYDLRTGKRYGHGQIEKISPFVCIGGNDLMDSRDVEDLLQAGMGTYPGTPREDVVRESLNHRNPEVRRIARQLIGDGTGEAVVTSDAKDS